MLLMTLLSFSGEWNVHATTNIVSQLKVWNITHIYIHAAIVTDIARLFLITLACSHELL